MVCSWTGQSSHTRVLWDDDLMMEPRRNKYCAPTKELGTTLNYYPVIVSEKYLDCFFNVQDSRIVLEPNWFSSTLIRQIVVFPVVNLNIITIKQNSKWQWNDMGATKENKFSVFGSPCTHNHKSVYFDARTRLISNEAENNLLCHSYNIIVKINSLLIDLKCVFWHIIVFRKIVYSG